MSVELERLNREPKLLTESEAKPCPFCSSQPTIQYWHGGGPQKRMIQCDDDSCVVSPSTTGTTRKQALSNWNYRAGD